MELVRLAVLLERGFGAVNLSRVGAGVVVTEQAEDWGRDVGGEVDRGDGGPVNRIGRRRDLAAPAVDAGVDAVELPGRRQV